MIQIASRNLPLLILAMMWEAAARFEVIGSFSLPTLVEVARAWFDLVVTGEMITNAWTSMIRLGGGLIVAILVGAALGIFMAWFRPIHFVMAPLVEITYPLPKSALIPVTAIWLGFGDSSKILLIALGCMLPVTLGAFNGARGAERSLVWSARSMGASRLRTLWDVVVPSALPDLFNGIRSAIALSWVLLVASELIVSRHGLGYLIGYLGDGAAFDAMFAVILTVAFLGFLADRAFQIVQNRALRWRE